MNLPEMTGFRKPINTGKTRRVMIAVVKHEGNAASCSCGVVMHHRRPKVLEDKIDRHFATKHNGRGIRL